MKPLLILFVSLFAITCTAQRSNRHSNVLDECYRQKSDECLRSFFESWHNAVTPTPTAQLNDTLKVLRQLHSIVYPDKDSSRFFLLATPIVFVGGKQFLIKDSTVFLQWDSSLHYYPLSVYAGQYSTLIDFMGRDPYDKYNSPYFEVNPSKIPGKRKMVKEQSAYGKRCSFISKKYVDNTRNSIGINISPDLKEAIVTLVQISDSYSGDYEQYFVLVDDKWAYKSFIPEESFFSNRPLHFLKSHRCGESAPDSSFILNRAFYIVLCRDGMLPSLVCR